MTANPLDDVMYNLKVSPIPATCSVEADHQLIGETLLRLPTRVRNKILDTVTFVAMGDVLGQTEEDYCPPHAESKRGWDIYINFPAMRKSPKSRVMETIAHECAHVVLHKTYGTGGLEAEKGADDLIEKWGFKRTYKSYRQFGSASKKKAVKME